MVIENIAGMWIVGEDMPQSNNRVTLNTDVKDQYGNPVPNVHFDEHPNDIAMRTYAYEKAERFIMQLELFKLGELLLILLLIILVQIE